MITRSDVARASPGQAGMRSSPNSSASSPTCSAAHGLMIEHASTYNRVLLDFLDRAEAAWQARQDDGALGGATDAAVGTAAG